MTKYQREGKNKHDDAANATDGVCENSGLVVSIYSDREVILLELENARDLINKYLLFHANFVANALRAQRYYIGNNYIKHRKNKKDLQEGNPNPLRNADNRIAFNFHGLLVNQKASYIFTAPPIFTLKMILINTFIADTFGDAYAKKAKDLCVEASIFWCWLGSLLD